MLNCWADVGIIRYDSDDDPNTMTPVRRRSSSQTLVFATPWEPSDRGGVNLVVAELANFVAKSTRFRAQLFINDWSSRLPRRGRCGCFEATRMRLRHPTLPKGMRRLYQVPSLFLELLITHFRLRRWVRQDAVAGINVHFVGLWVVHFILLKRFRRHAPVVVLSFHGSDFSKAAASTGVTAKLWRWMIRNADAVTAPSSELSRRIENRFDLPLGTVTPVHNGIHATAFSEALQRARVPAEMCDGRLWILNIGAFEFKKGQDVLIKAFAQVRRAVPNLALMLVGQRAEELVSLSRLVRDLDLQDCILLREEVPHDRIPAYIKGAHLFVFPSREEPFGIALLEAALGRLPTIASRTGGIPEILTNAKLGVLVPPDDPRTLSRELERLLLDRKRQTELGEAFYHHVKENFSWTTTCSTYLNLLA